MQKLTQMKDYLLELSFLALLIKIVVIGAGIGEALAIISLVFSITYNKWLNKAKIEQYEELTNRMLLDKEELKKEIEMLNSKLTGITLDKSIKRTSLNEPELQKPTAGSIKRLF